MGLMKKMASVLVTASLLFGLVGTAFAVTPSQVDDGAKRLQALGIVVGDSNGDMKLGDPITRAQLMKVMVWAFGQKDNAAILKGAVAFPDTSTHWASGEIAIAKNIIVEKNHFEMGMPDGNFAPEGKVTAAQAVAFLMKFVGIAPDSSKTWPNNYLDAAVSSGMISADVRDSISSTANTEATRGLVFFLADTAFAGYPLSSGKTVYQTYSKPSAPTLTAEATELTTTATKVTINGTVSADAKSVYVGNTSNTVTVNNGSFSYEYNLELGANPIVVGATDIVGNTATQSLTVTRTVGVAVSIDAPAAVTVKAGESAALTVAVKDAIGNVLADAPVTVTSDLGTYAAGQFTAGTKAATGTATVTSGDLSVSVNVTVEAGALAKVIVAPATIDLSAGTSQKFVATGADQYDNAVALTNAVNWTSSKGVMGPDGTFGATQDATGTVTVTATAGTVSGSATATVFGAPAKVQIAAPASMVADAESEVTLTATVLDANGNVAKNYNGKVTFTSTNTTYAKVETATVDAVNGYASTTLLATNTAGKVVLSATASNLQATTVTYTTVAQKLTSFKMEADPGTINAKTSSRGSVTITALDQNGKEMLALASGYKVKITTSDKDAVTLEGLASKEYALDADGSTTLSQKLYGTTRQGSTSLTAVVSAAPSGASKDIPVSSTSVSTILAGDADHLVVDAIAEKASSKTVTVTVRVVDFQGNQITTDAGDITTGNYTVTVKKGTTVVSPTVAKSAVDNGVGTFTIDWSSLSSSTGTAGTYTVLVESGTLTDGTQTASVIADEATKLSLSVSPATIAANSSSSSVLTVKVYDAENNLVTNGSYDVKITRTGSKVTSAADEQTVTTSNGVATFIVTGSTATGTDTFVASNDDLTSSASKTVSVAILGSAHKVVLVDADGDSSEGGSFNAFAATAGKDKNITVAVQDAASNTLTFDQGTPVTVEVFNGTTSLGTWSGSTVDGVATIPVNLTKATSTGFKVVATSGSLKKVEKAAAITVAANAPTKITMTTDLDTIAAKTGGTASVAALSFQLKDDYGNSVTTSDGSADGTIYVIESTTDFGVVSGTRRTNADQPYYNYLPVTINDGVGSATFTSDVRAGSITLTAESDDWTSDSVSITTVVIGDADDIVASSPASVTVSNATSDKQVQAITVSIVDGAGHVRTLDSTSKITITDDSATTNLFVKKSDGTWEAYNAGTNNVVTKGSITFGVINTIAEDVDYDFAFSTFTAEASGTFVPGAAHHVAMVGNTDEIAGNGISSIGVTAKVVDQFNNPVSGFNGTMKFVITNGNDFAYLQDTTAPIVDGVATVIARSHDVTSDSAVKVKAGADIDEDGTIESDEYSTSVVVFNVDGNAPAVTSATPDLTQGTDNTALDAGDTVTITFNENTNKPTLTAASFAFQTSTDTFGTGATFAWNTNGNVLTITVGASPALADDVFFASGVELKDEFGNTWDIDDLLFDL